MHPDPSLTGDPNVTAEIKQPAHVIQTKAHESSILSGKSCQGRNTKGGHYQRNRAFFTKFVHQKEVSPQPALSVNMKPAYGWVTQASRMVISYSWTMSH